MVAHAQSERNHPLFLAQRSFIQSLDAAYLRVITSNPPRISSLMLMMVFVLNG